MTTPPPDALEQIARLEASGKLMKQIELYHNGIDLLSWLLPLARAQLEGWRPIETAPAGFGTPIVRWHRIWNCPMSVMRNDLGAEGLEWVTVCRSYTWSEGAFHPFWMPISALPTPPQKDEEDE